MDCQTCHIPSFAREFPTKTYWTWTTAGDKEKGVITEEVAAEEPVEETAPAAEAGISPVIWGLIIAAAVVLVVGIAFSRRKLA